MEEKVAIKICKKNSNNNYGNGEKLALFCTLIGTLIISGKMSHYYRFCNVKQQQQQEGQQHQNDGIPCHFGAKNIFCEFFIRIFHS